MLFDIKGDAEQVVEVTLDKAESTFFEKGTLLWKTDPSWTKVISQGFKKMLIRLLTGEHLCLYQYTAKEKPVTLCFAPQCSSKVVAFNPEQDGDLVLFNSKIIAGSTSVERKKTFAKKNVLKAFISGVGICKWHLSGTGTVLCEYSGERSVKTLSEEETLEIAPTCVIAASEEIKIKYIRNKHFLKVLFGVEELYKIVLCGPGKVWITTDKVYRE